MNKESLAALKRLKAKQHDRALSPKNLRLPAIPMSVLTIVLDEQAARLGNAPEVLPDWSPLKKRKRRKKAKSASVKIDGEAKETPARRKGAKNGTEAPEPSLMELGRAARAARKARRSYMAPYMVRYRAGEVGGPKNPAWVAKRSAK